MKLYCCNAVNPAGVDRPVFSWKLTRCDDKIQKAYQLTVFSPSNQIVWDSGNVLSSRSSYIKYEGEPLQENTKYSWQVRVFTENQELLSDPATFTTGLYDFSNIHWIGADNTINSPFLYKQFTVDSISKYATVNICGLGFFELYINGKKVSNHLMNPVRTDYDTVTYQNLAYPYENETKKRVCYLTYEVSQYLTPGENYAVIWLGNGWFRQNGRLTEGTFHYGDDLKCFFKLTNGEQIIQSDESWQYAQSPLVYDNLFYGEVYDSRINQQLLYHYDDSLEDNFVHSVPAPSGDITPQLCPADKILHSYSPVAITDNLYDTGECVTGFAELAFRGKAGDKITISYAEEINDDNTLNFTSTVGYVEVDEHQIQQDVYILGSDEQETYCPRFVWHAFRYFHISAPENVEIVEAKVHYVASDLTLRTEFHCSNETLNTLHKLCLNTGLSNVHGCVPMDCPHRERLGYTGDGQLSSLTMMYNFDAYHLYHKWIHDIIDAQTLSTGFIPHTAPFNGGGGGPAWGSAVAVVPWNFYMQYGDVEILKHAKEPIKHWIRYLSSRKENGLIAFEEKGSWCLGDWCMPSKYPWSEPHLDEIKIPSELVNTTYYIYCIEIYLNILHILGEEADPWFSAEKEDAILAFNNAFLKSNYCNGDQGSDVFPLFADIVPENEKNRIFGQLIEKLKNNHFCFDTGINGTHLMFQVLDKYGRNDIALKMLLNEQYPGYGNFVKNGATALWETWEGNGSKNHTAFSSFDAWLFYGLAGIKPDPVQGGYQQFSIEPFFAEELNHVTAKLECEHGTIGVEWTRQESEIAVKITIPFNTKACVTLPGNCTELTHGVYEFQIHSNKTM